MKVVWARLGRPDAINWTVISIIAPLQVAGAFVGTQFDMEGRVLLFTACNIGAVLTAVAAHLIGRYLIVPHTPEKVRPLVTLAIFEVGALFRAFSFEYVMVTLEFLPESQIVWRIFGSQTNLFVGAIVVSSLVAMAREFSASNEALARSLSELESSKADIELRVEQRKKSLGASIRQQLSAAMGSLRGTNLGLDAATLQSLIDDVVRPLSHQLGRVFTPGGHTTPHTLPTEISWPSVFRHTLTINPLRPAWTTLWFAIGALQFFALAVGPGFLAPLAVAIVVFAAWFVLAQWAWPIITKRLSLPMRALVLTLTAGLLPLILNSLIEMVFQLEIVTTRLVLTESLWFVIITWTVSLVSGLAGLLIKTNQELSRANLALKRQLIIDRVHARHFEEGIARVLHGPVQDAIASSLRRIMRLPEGTQLTRSEIHLIRQPIEEALDLLDAPSATATPVAEGIGQLAALWAGVVEIDTRLEENASSLLQSSPTTSSIVLEIAREAISNAIRHGDASHIDVHIHADSVDHTVHLSVSNDGRALPAGEVASVGTRLLDDMTLNWTRSNESGRVVLTASIPLETLTET